MRPAETIVQRLQLHQQRIGEHRTRLGAESGQIDGHARCRLIERGENIGEPRDFVSIAEHLHLARHLQSADIRIDDAALVTAREELLQEPIAQRSLAAAVRPVHQQRIAARRDLNRRAVLADTDSDLVARHRIGQIGRDQIARQLQKSFAVRALRGAIRDALHERVGVLYRHCVPGELEQRQVVLAVADRNQIVARHSELAQCSPHARGLVDAGGQHHERARVGDELEIELQLAQRSADFGLVRLDGGYDRAADRKRRHVPTSQLLQQDLRRRLRQDLGLARRGSDA